ncbi:MAG: sugar phosphate nucleotidyltransferase, partial [Bdellovibrionota bacterium]
GVGSRLHPFTESHPKATLPILGVPAIQFGIDWFRRFGIDRFVVNLHSHSMTLRNDLSPGGKVDWAGARVIQSDETSALLGSAGGLARARPHFESQPFFYSNADRIWELDLTALAAAHFRNRQHFRASLTLAIQPIAPPGGKYREFFLHRDGRISGIGALVERRAFFMGIAIIEPEAIAAVPDQTPSEFVPMILEPAIALGRAGYFLTQGRWYDMDSPALWADSHFKLLEALEVGELPTIWRKRIEAVNRRHGHALWASRKMPRMTDLSGVHGPAYLDLENWSGPIHAGPRVALYGGSGVDSQPEPGLPLENMIRYESKEVRFV